MIPAANSVPSAFEKRSSGERTRVGKGERRQPEQSRSCQIELERRPPRQRDHGREPATRCACRCGHWIDDVTVALGRQVMTRSRRRGLSRREARKKSVKVGVVAHVRDSSKPFAGEHETVFSPAKAPSSSTAAGYCDVVLMPSRSDARRRSRAARKALTSPTSTWIPVPRCSTANSGRRRQLLCSCPRPRQSGRAPPQTPDGAPCQATRATAGKEARLLRPGDVDQARQNSTAWFYLLKL